MARMTATEIALVWTAWSTKLRLAAIGALAVSLPALPTFAARIAPDPTEIRWVDRHGSSGECRNDPSSPLCALETTLSDFLRSASKICTEFDTPRIPDDSFPVLAIIPYFERECVIVPSAIEYVVTSQFTITDKNVEALKNKLYENMPKDMRKELEKLPNTYLQPGNIRVELGVRYHAANDLIWPPEGWEKKRYTLIPQGNRWTVRGGLSGVHVRRVRDFRLSGECIGRPTTPLCAVETFFACRVRSDIRLCEMADATYGQTFRPWKGTVAYIVYSMRTVEALGLESRPHPTVIVWLNEWLEFPDYTQWPPCGRDQEPMCPRAESTGYAVERVNGRWRVIDWALLPNGDVSAWEGWFGERPGRPQDQRERQAPR